MDLGDRRLSREEEAAAGSTDTCSGPVCSGLASSQAPQLSKPPHPANKDMHLAGAQNEAPPPGPAFPTTPLSAQACPRGNPLPPSPYTHTQKVSALRPLPYLVARSPGCSAGLAPGVASQGTEVRVIINQASVEGEGGSGQQRGRTRSPSSSAHACPGPQATEASTRAVSGRASLGCSAEVSEASRKEQHDSGLASCQGWSQTDAPLYPPAPSALLLVHSSPLRGISS